MKYIYWDSNCFIGYLKDEEYGRDARMGVGGIKFEEPNVADYPYQLCADLGE